MGITPFPYGESVVVVRPGGRDHHGDPLDDTEHTIDGVAIYPVSIEESANGTTLDADEVMLAPYGADVAAEDTIYRASDTDRDSPLYVKGDTWRVKHVMTGWQPGARVLLTYRRGGTS